MKTKSLIIIAIAVVVLTLSACSKHTCPAYTTKCNVEEVAVKV